MKVINVDINKIEQNENSRVIFKNHDLSELMASMKRDGLLQPVGVRQLPNGSYDAVFGNRRILAAKKLGWKTIEASVIEAETDNDRDILNLVENFKRQNTSVSEDGRIFQKLKDSGLGIREISVRLGVNELRVSNAIDVFNEFPDDLKNNIVNGTSRTRKVGQIAASVAFAVNTVRKSNGLNRRQTRTLLNYARKPDVGIQQINSVAPLLKAGYELSKALSIAERVTTITLTLSVDSNHMDRLEKKGDKTFHELCYEILESDKSLKVSRAGMINKSPEQRVHARSLRAAHA